MNKDTKQIRAGDYAFNFLKSGDLFNITYKNIMIDQLIGNEIDGSVNNLYLRIHEAEQIKAYPLLGVSSQSDVAFSEKHVVWQGKVANIDYSVHFYLTDLGVWFWEVDIHGHDVEVDLVYGQDIGIADIGAVRNNEAYLSQYIDHSIYEDEKLGYVVCSRQNQGQSTGFPYLQQGALTKAAGYSTDGFQFFGLSYKETNQPEVLSETSLPNAVYQYEFAYIALQSERIKLAGQSQFVFYGLFSENHPDVVSELEYTDKVCEAWQQLKNEAPKVGSVEKKIQKKGNIGAPLAIESFTLEELEKQYPIRHQEEYEGDTLISFFTDTHEHIVLKEKELIVERPHGHILMNGQNHKLQENTLATTTYMYGVFNSQLVVGNTNFNKMITNPRNPLNTMKTSGQRIYVEIDGIYHLLTMPSVYEIGFNYTRWYYKTNDETFIITNYTTVDTPEVRLHLQSKSGVAYRYYVTSQVSLNNNEFEVPYHCERTEDIMTFKAGSSSDNSNIYPDLMYRLKLEGADFELADERVIMENVHPSEYALNVLVLEATNEWHMTIQGLLHGEELPFIKRKAHNEIERYREYYHQVMNGFNLTENNKRTEALEKVNALAWWYTHNMLVHFSSPHGLEQYGGAAWGTRDVCQGPMEYFMATQKYASVKEIIRTVFTHQFEDDGSWPQWFMFDEYSHIQAGESHGDIIVWPLKMVTDYLTVTKDFSILEDEVPYTVRNDGFKLTEETATIYEHMQKEIQYIKDHFLHDTYLSSYGDGDWDDTLQPANAQLKQYMVSSWTVALTYQVFDKLSHTLKGFDEKGAAELAELATGIQSDFNEYMLESGVVPGFVYMENPNAVELMLHPEDEKTGIHYRLLPMQRSIISELFTKEQAESHYALIKEHLECPDGVRLMNRPANYTGGVSTHFQRAETAANFGREVGLQYVHAHIRFIEAMAKLGKADEVWTGLSKINPINIQDVVPNAERRQSNTYFSSSDGKFNTRYEAQEHFNQLRDGSVAVKGGWRIYSSGPGIYMNQLISHWLGIRLENGGLVIDPVMSNDFDGLHFDFTINQKPVTFIYNINGDGHKVTINNKKVEGRDLENRYRCGGLFINADQLALLSEKQENIVEIYI